MELLKCGLRRSIGDGTQVKAFKDPWLSRPRFIQVDLLVEWSMESQFATKGENVYLAYVPFGFTSSNTTYLPESSVGVWSVLRRCAHGPMQEILRLLFDRLSCEAFELMMTTLWWLWYDRNSILFGNKQSRLDIILDLASNHMTELKEYDRREPSFGIEPYKPSEKLNYSMDATSS
uniref:Uncharacterized protein n=1 Tax=Cannabis sativa TaxID=3483 RepID=A0A803NT23_CANSA